MRKATPKTRGFILVQALLVVAGLLALVAVLAASQRVALNGTQNRLRERRAQIAARSAVNIALSALQNANANVTALTDSWATVGDNGDAAYQAGDAATFRFQIQDAGARININVATETQLQTLPVTQEQIDSLLDWREAGQQARPQGAKDAYYNALPQPYNAHLGTLTTENELLLIKGWTAKNLYSPPGAGVSAITSTAPPLEDTDGNPLPLIDALTAESGTANTRADGTARINLSGANVNPQVLTRLGLMQAVSSQIVARAPIRSWNNLLSIPGITARDAQTLLDSVSVTGTPRLEGRINLNTAPQSVLENALALTPDVASAIISRQSSNFRTLGEVATIPGLATNQLARIADSIGIGSDTWIVRANGESGGVGVPVEATIGLRSGRIQILKYQQLNEVTIPAWWNWQAEPTAVSPIESLASALASSSAPASTGGTP